MFFARSPSGLLPIVFAAYITSEQVQAHVHTHTDARHFMLLDGGKFSLMHVMYTGTVHTVAYRDCVADIVATATTNVTVNASCFT